MLENGQILEKSGNLYNQHIKNGKKAGIRLGMVDGCKETAFAVSGQ